jgi:hypothetical protein
LPGCAERIVGLTERQSAHRQRLEWRALSQGLVRSYLGLGCGLVVAVAFGYWSYDLIRAGHEIAGSILGVADLGGLVGVFVIGQTTVARDLANKRQQMDKLKKR